MYTTAACYHGQDSHRIKLVRDSTLSSEYYTDDTAYIDIWQYQRILTLDGVGAKGLFSLYVLQRLMDEVAKIEQTTEPHALSSASSPLYLPVKDTTSWAIQSTASQFRPCHYFDYICGSGMGGINALMLGTLRLSVNDAIDRAKCIYDGLEWRLSSRPVSSFSWPGAGNWKAKNSSNLRFLLWKYLENEHTQSKLPLTSGKLSKRQSRRASELASLMGIDEVFCKTYVSFNTKILHRQLMNE